MVTPATIGWNIVEQLLEPEEVPRRLRRVRRLVEVGEPEQRRAHERREDGDARPSRSGSTRTRPRAGAARRGPCPGPRRVVCWIDPDLTTVSSRWVWPPGPVAVGAASAGAAVAVAVPPRAAGAARRRLPPPAPPPVSAARRRRDRSSRCAGTPPLGHVSAVAVAAGRRGAGARPRPPARAPRPRSSARSARRRRRRPARRGRPRSARLAAFFPGHGEAERLAALLAAPQQVFGYFGHRLSPRPTAARRCRRPCGRARSGRP